MVYSRNLDHPLTAALRQLLLRHLPAGGAFCVGLSGGMDSSSLLHAALPLRESAENWELSACHVNHGLSRRAARWEAFCRDQCAAAAVPLKICRGDAPPGANEEWARNLRLRSFAGLDAAVVLLAHHADDQAETVLFRLLRGTGVHGMAAMRTQTPLSGKMILRPWLQQPRRLIVDYAKKNRLCWVEDEDNANLLRRRNALRHRAMPAISEDFPDCRRALVAAGARIRDSSVLLSQLAELDEQTAAADGGWRVDYFRHIGEMRTRNWLYYALLKRRLRFSERHIAEAARQIVGVSRNRRQGLCFDFGDAVLRRWRGGLYWDQPPQKTPSHFESELKAAAGVFPLQPLGGDLILRDCVGGGLSPTKIGSLLHVRLRQGGERIVPQGGRPTRTVADLLQEAAVAPWHRRRLPFIFAKGRLAAVPGVVVAAEFAATKNETGLECRFERAECQDVVL